MKLLLDTHLLLWAAGSPDRLSAAARPLLEDPLNELLFSAGSLIFIHTLSPVKNKRMKKLI